LERLELILSLTRELGVNLAGVEVVLNMRRRMEEMQKELQEFITYIEREIANRSPEMEQRIQHALVRVTPPHVAVVKSGKTDRSV
jgi:MerR family transcriptional regulator/heat shock protein HspR